MAPSSGFYFRRLAGHVFVTTFRTFVTLPAGTKPDPILDMLISQTSSSLFVSPYLIPHVYVYSCRMDNLRAAPTKSPANLVCNRQNKSARNANASSTTRHDLRFVGSIAMGSRDDNVGPASPVRCIGGKTVACFPQLRSPDRGVREPLIPSGRATSGHHAGVARSGSRSGSSPGYSDLSDDKDDTEPTVTGRKDRELEQFTVYPRGGAAMGT